MNIGISGKTQRHQCEWNVQGETNPGKHRMPKLAGQRALIFFVALGTGFVRQMENDESAHYLVSPSFRTKYDAMVVILGIIDIYVSPTEHLTALSCCLEAAGSLLATRFDRI